MLNCVGCLLSAVVLRVVCCLVCVVCCLWVAVPCCVLIDVRGVLVVRCVLFVV